MVNMEVDKGIICKEIGDSYLISLLYLSYTFCIPIFCFSNIVSYCILDIKRLLVCGPGANEVKSSMGRYGSFGGILIL